MSTFAGNNEPTLTTNPAISSAKKILVMGLPGAGKTILASALASRLNAVHFNADEIRMNINRDLGFAHADRIEHARRLGWLCDRVLGAGTFAIADFVCPTEATRTAFGDAFTIWLDRIQAGRFADTNELLKRHRSATFALGRRDHRVTGSSRSPLC
jgi:hypothetical protein